MVYECVVRSSMEPTLIVIAFFAILLLFLGIACSAPSKRGRVIGAFVAFAWSCLMFMAANMVERFNLNAWYSSAADELLDSSIEAIDAGRADHVSAELAEMRDELEVTYQYRGKFDELARATARRIRSTSSVGDKAKSEAQQADRGQAATRHESQSDGGDAAQPDEEGRSR
ncbi:MAG: hypothetical protein RL117_694 [Verrucomicrobiota bacterium]|jgi:hypothetical protein